MEKKVKEQRGLYFVSIFSWVVSVQMFWVRFSPIKQNVFFLLGGATTVVETLLLSKCAKELVETGTEFEKYIYNNSNDLPIPVVSPI